MSKSEGFYSTLLVRQGMLLLHARFPPHGEGMWVTITRLDNRTAEGTLASTPVDSPNYHYGQLVHLFNDEKEGWVPYITDAPLKIGDNYNGHKMTPLTLSVKEIVDEYKVASQKFPPFNSIHEGYAIILEELDELEEEVFKQHNKRDREKLRAEAKQVAAMALRFMVDLTL